MAMVDEDYLAEYLGNGTWVSLKEDSDELELSDDPSGDGSIIYLNHETLVALIEFASRIPAYQEELT